ncbi:MAG TPA: kelch repeat-containing protein [Planctomycetota bacterium]|nr:kelch repeat-containing protein [Planctomycetota bacterium]
MATDTGRGQILLSGGWDGSSNLADTWLFDAAGWHQLAVSGRGPHSSHRLAFDPARGVVVSFGGWDGTNFLGDTWEWNGAAWRQLFLPTSPAARYSHAMVFDAARGVALMFGGFCGTGCYRGDSWSFDGTTWTQLLPATAPSPRYSAGMAYDGARQRVVLYGGRSALGQESDTWEWDGTNWTHRSATGPGPRSTPAMAFDPLRNRVVLFSGFNGASYAANVFEWDGTTWLARATSPTPAGRGFSAMAFDPNSGATLLFGGDAAGGILGDTWLYGPLHPANMRPFGSGCGASLAGLQAPWLGDMMAVEMTALPTSIGMAGLCFGLSNQLWNGALLPLDLGANGMTGCHLYVSLDAVVPGTSVGGVLRWSTSIPNSTALLGVVCYLQSWAQSPGANPAGVVAANALEVQVGAR